jgi:radical SAM superfamily enzyme YgiQ (UPF0313 family)
MSKTDIIFIKPGSQRQVYGELSDFGLTAIEPPLWAAILAGYMRDLGYTVLLLDEETQDWDHATTSRRAIDTRPLLVAVVVSGTNPSASTMNMTGALKIAEQVKAMSDSKVLLMGLHPSALPETTVMEPAVDFVCQGEGFFTLPPLIEALKVQPTGKFHIHGLWYKQDGECCANPRAPLFQNLDTLPLPAWDLLPMKTYRAHNWHCFGHIHERQPYAVLYTSLGCPFVCRFCCINALFGENRIRYRSIDSVLAELDFLVKTYDIKNIKIIDEMFALDEKRTISVCRAIAERGYDLNMWAYARVDRITDKMLSEMKTAGIHWLAYGFESGNSRVLKSVAKGFQIEKARNIAGMTSKMGIHICANFIFGLPQDDLASMNDTLGLMLDLNTEWANIYSAMAYPGSRLYHTALKKGWRLPETWEGYSQYSFDTLPLPTNYLNGGQVLSFRDHAFQTYYTNSRYLDMIEKKFGKQTVAYIEEITQHRIKRKFAE